MAERAELKKKIRVRGGHRAAVKRYLSHADEVLDRPDRDPVELSRMKLSLEEKLEILKQLDSDIVELIEEDEATAADIEQADIIKEGIYGVLVRIESCISTKPADVTAPKATPKGGDGTNKVKLPKLTIQHFDGELTAWLTFWDSFRSAIHDNVSLTDIDKFNYLKSLLERSALEAVSGLTLTSANYKEAISILQKRFGDTKQIIARHMDVLLNIEPVASQHNVKGLRHLYDSIESHVRSLKALGVTSDSYGNLLSSVLLNKLPSELRLIVSRGIKDADRWDLDAFMKSVEDEIRARERASLHNQQKRLNKEPPTVSTFFSGGQHSISCCYCQQGHSSSSCQNVTDAGARSHILRKSGRCFVCLRKGHISRDCRSSLKCSKCNGRHHVTICSKNAPTNCSKNAAGKGPATPLADQQTKFTNSTHSSGLNPKAPVYSGPSTTQPQHTSATSNSQSVSMCVGTDRAVLLQTAQACIFNPSSPQMSLRVRVILDCGSQWSYITSQVRDQLMLESDGKQQMSIVTFGSTEGKPLCCDCVKVGLSLKDGKTKHLSMFVVPLICQPLACQPVDLCQERFEHLSGLELADMSDGSSRMNIDLLVGSDQYWELITGQTRRGSDGPIAIHTELGWVLSGPAIPEQQFSNHTMTSHTLRVDGLIQKMEPLDDLLKSFWDLESFGVIDAKVPSVLERFEETIKFRDSRYEVALPWKEFHPPLPDNLGLCEKRLASLFRRLQHDPDILQEYDATIQHQLQRGIVEVVKQPFSEEAEKIHYLPHHAVIRRDRETTKLRIVYDASAKSAGPSLNDCLHSGPKFNQKIFDILLRFRLHRIAVLADIEKAFLMISVADPDRDALRFLWYDDVFKPDPVQIVLRFARVVFGVSSSPFLLNATIHHHLNQFIRTQPELVHKLSRSIYVDDIASGASDDQQAYNLYKKAKEVLKTGGFNLRKFVSNSLLLQARVDAEESPTMTPNLKEPDYLQETYSKSILGSSHTLAEDQKVLGVRWNVAADIFVFSFEDIINQSQNFQPTKRNVVSLVGKFYDPLGFIAPVVIQFKIFMQALCEARLSWDEPLSGKLLERWNLLYAGLVEAQHIRVPRCYLDGIQDEVVTYRLCGFCDASCGAYAAVVYLHMDTPAGQVVKLVASRTRVAPLKKQTIPRLELLSALLLARLTSSISTSLESEVKLAPPRCYGDSKVALFWIHGIDKDWKPFVLNRVLEIRQLVPVECWGHCPGHENPADIPSRGLSPLELSVNKLWHCGPAWMKSLDNCTLKVQSIMPEECVTEMKTKEKMSYGLLVSDENLGLGRVMEIKDFSSISRLLSVTARILRFCHILQSRIHPEKNLPSLAEEVSCAETLWVREMQLMLLHDRNFRTWKKQFGLFLDHNGVWRCQGRITQADVPYSAKHPIMLHKSHYLTKLFVKQAHQRVSHDGVRETLTELRSRFWIVKGRVVVKQIVHFCTVCRRHEGKSYPSPQPPPLPDFRVTEAPPFTFTGVDFAGPLYVRSGGEGRNKTWLCLYTCCVVRAVHLDLVPDLSTPTFLRSFRRFVGRRGLPQKMLSDNAKTFKASAKAIKTLLSDVSLSDHFSSLSVEWNFNLPKAPWWGGVFERMIRSTKRCLRKVVGQARLSYDELLTALVEIEMIINSRPLSFVSTDDFEEPLTPSHLMYGRRLLSIPDRVYRDNLDDTAFDTAFFSKRAQHLSHTLDRFWLRWRNEYLLELREAHRYNQGNSNNSHVSVGDVVVVRIEGQPRGFWKIAKVERTIIGQDGVARGAVVRVAGRGGQTKTLSRPIQHLFPLEVNCQTEDHAQALHNGNFSNSASAYDRESDDLGGDDEEVVDLSQQHPSPDREGNPPRRSARGAARMARDAILAQALAETD